MKTNTSPIINLESFKTMVLLKKLKEEDPAWLPENELFYQRMEKNIMMAIEERAKAPLISPRGAADIALDMKPMAMSQRHFSK